MEKCTQRTGNKMSKPETGDRGSIGRAALSSSVVAVAKAIATEMKTAVAETFAGAIFQFCGVAHGGFLQRHFNLFFVHISAKLVYKSAAKHPAEESRASASAR